MNEIELSSSAAPQIELDDAFSEKVVAERMPLVHPSVIGDGRLNTLPEVLCDETLLGEIRSIPEKMGFKIGEVADLLGIKQYVLRYWESEFDVLKPKKAANNQRYYTKKDVELAYVIRKLLHRDRFSIEGAKTALKEVRHVVKKEKDWTKLNQKVETLQDRVDDLLLDLRRLKTLFN